MGRKLKKKKPTVMEILQEQLDRFGQSSETQTLAENPYLHKIEKKISDFDFVEIGELQSARILEMLQHILVSFCR